MNKRKLYLELFGLKENATIDEIKKKYRQLAKTFHPDLNNDKNAHDRFLLIQEAYDYLLHHIYDNSQTIYYENSNLEKDRIDKIRIAKERLNEYYKRKEIQRKIYTNKFYNSNFWKTYKLVAYICLMFSMMNIIDFLLPKNEIDTIITEVSENFNGLNNDEIVLLKTIEGNKFFIINNIKNYFNFNDSIKIIESKLLNTTYRAVVKNNQEEIDYKTLNSNYYFLIFTNLFLLVPYLLLVNNKRSIEEIFLIKIIFSIFLPISLFLILN